MDKNTNVEISEEKEHRYDSENLALSKCRHTNQYRYNRVRHESLGAAQSAIAYRYGWTCRKYIQSLITSSGMAAISAVLHNILIECQFSSDGINVIYGDELYCDTPTLIQYLQKSYRCRFNIHPINVIDTESIIKLFGSDGIKDKINILLIETCSNPSGYIFDFSIIPKLHSLSNHLYVVMDNTWCSSVVFNPFNHCQSIKPKKTSSPKVASDPNDLNYSNDSKNSRDSEHSESALTMIAVTSLSKYYSGGSCIGGAIISDDEAFMSSVKEWISMHGHHVSPIHCKLVLENMNSMNQRILKTSAMTLNVARFLKEFDNEMVNVVKYPLLENHVSYKMAQKYWKKGYGPSVLYFRIAYPVKTEDEAWECMHQWARDGVAFEVKTSYGGKDTRFEQMDDSVDENGMWIRMAIGFEDEEREIIKSLKSLFEKLRCDRQDLEEKGSSNVEESQPKNE